MESVFVYVRPLESSAPILAGRLDFAEQISFQYAGDWLAHPDRHAFHPVCLPLTTDVFTSDSLDGALSVFRDAGPGAWGCEVIKRLHEQVGLADQLIMSNNLLRIGVFRYSRSPEGFSDVVVSPTWSTDELYAAIKAMGSGEALTDTQSAILAQGSGMDGMRPKAFINIDGASWVLKMPSKNDYANEAVNEFIGMTLACACGIETPEVRLLPLPDGKQAIAIKRFDTDGQRNLPLMSAASALGYRNGEPAKQDYREVARVLTGLSADASADKLSLFKRMALNVMISNRDDHLFNQALIRKDGGWRLAPVYDVVCGEGMRRGHALTIGDMGSTGTLSNVLSAADAFGLTVAQAKDVVEQMICDVRNWKTIAKNSGVQQSDITQVDWAILHKDIFAGCVSQPVSVPARSAPRA